MVLPAQDLAGVCFCPELSSCILGLHFVIAYSHPLTMAQISVSKGAAPHSSNKVKSPSQIFVYIFLHATNFNLQLCTGVIAESAPNETTYLACCFPTWQASPSHLPMLEPRPFFKVRLEFCFPPMSPARNIFPLIFCE